MIFWQSARETVDIDIDPRNMTIADARADVWTTDIKEVWTQSSDGVLDDVGNGESYGSSKQ